MQIANVLTGFLTGIPALVAIGPIGLLLVELGLERGMRGGYPAALGVAMGDTLFAVLAAVAGTAVASALASVEGGLRVVAFVVLIGLALHLARSARSASRTPVDAGDPDDPDGVPALGAGAGVATAVRTTGGSTITLRGTRLAGGFLGLTVVNPLTIVVYAGIVMSGGAGVGTAGWVVGMGLASLAVHGGFVGLGHALGATVSDRAVVGLRWTAVALLPLLAVHLLMS